MLCYTIDRSIWYDILEAAWLDSLVSWYSIFMTLFILPGSVRVAQLRHGENHLLHVVGVRAHLEFTNLITQKTLIFTSFTKYQLPAGHS